jgi:2-polyprenyl-3-methyl-5-hydroxy-6-metoxy-1,4-benzoquinol methylase
MDWDEAYGENAAFFGTALDRVLLDHEALLDATRPVLDIGAGQGRNALHLARQGFRVDAIDPSAAAVTSHRDAASREGLDVHSTRAGFLDHAAEPRSYGTILAMGLIPILDRRGIEQLASRIGLWIAPGGLVFVTAFTVADPSYSRHLTSARSIGKNSFASIEGGIRTFLEPRELPTLFPGFEVVHRWEGAGPHHRHGNGPLHRHAWAEVVLRC